jgi:hypothetical protein
MWPSAYAIGYSTMFLIIALFDHKYRIRYQIGTRTVTDIKMEQITANFPTDRWS